MSEKIITERELVLPALYLISKNFNNSTLLIEKLTELMHPEGLDAQILQNRHDTHFSQKVRNLKSHNTLSNLGYATYDNQEYFITDKGKLYLQNNQESLTYLFESDFKYQDVKESLTEINEGRTLIPINEIVSEGTAYFTTQKRYERSQKLRNIAIDYFRHDGHIHCDCCGFDFINFYGPNFGYDCIEIHHMKPLFMNEGEKIEDTVEHALANLLPVCPNCHRLIHRKHINIDQINTFKLELSRLHAQ